MFDTELHVILMTDCDRKEVTATAAASSSKQCTVDDFVMNGQQIKIESVESDREAKTDSSPRVQKNPTWSLKTEDEDFYREREVDGREEDPWIHLRVPNHCLACDEQLFTSECVDVKLQTTDDDQLTTTRQ